LRVLNRDGLSEREARATIGSVYKRESAQGTQRAQRDNAGIAALEAFAQGYDWKAHGRARNTDKAVFVALIQRARVTRNWGEGVHASIREIAGLAVIEHTTARRALARLVKHGLIERVVTSTDNPFDANVYRFTELSQKVPHSTAFFDATHHVELFENARESGEALPFVRYAQALQERAALGRSGYAILGALWAHEQGLTARGVSELSGVPLSTVYRYLSGKLRGAVELVPGTARYRVNYADAYEMLVGLAALGRSVSETRRKRHNQDRVRYLEERVYRSLYAHDAGALAVPADSHETLRAQGALSDAPPVPVIDNVDEPLLAVGRSLGATVREVDEGGDSVQVSARAEYVVPAAKPAASAQDEAWGALWARFNRAWTNTHGRVNSAARTARKHDLVFDAQALRAQLAHAQDLINTNSAAALAIVAEVNAALDALHDALKMKRDTAARVGRTPLTSQLTMFESEGVNHDCA